MLKEIEAKDITDRTPTIAVKVQNLMSKLFTKPNVTSTDRHLEIVPLAKLLPAMIA